MDAIPAVRSTVYTRPSYRDISNLRALDANVSDCLRKFGQRRGGGLHQRPHCLTLPLIPEVVVQDLVDNHGELTLRGGGGASQDHEEDISDLDGGVEEDEEEEPEDVSQMKKGASLQDGRIIFGEH